MNLQN